MLKPMRDAGILGKEEIPDAYHAEDLTGKNACALSAGRLLRIEDGVGTEMPLDSVREVREERGAVVIVGDRTVTCPFGEDEGGDRFARMLRNR